MRKVIDKNLTEPQILEATSTLVGEGIENLKLYFMIGLPEERDEDVMEIARLAAEILRAGARSRELDWSRNRFAQSVRAETMDPLPMGPDGAPAIDQAKGSAVAFRVEAAWGQRDRIGRRIAA